MAKGGYLGGSTIVGPGFGWSTYDDAASSSTVTNAKKRKKKAKAKPGNQPSSQRKPRSLATELQIAKRDASYARLAASRAAYDVGQAKAKLEAEQRRAAELEYRAVELERRVLRLQQGIAAGAGQAARGQQRSDEAAPKEGARPSNGRTPRSPQSLSASAKPGPTKSPPQGQPSGGLKGPARRGAGNDRGVR